MKQSKIIDTFDTYQGRCQVTVSSGVVQVQDDQQEDIICLQLTIHLKIKAK